MSFHVLSSPLVNAFRSVCDLTAAHGCSDDERTCKQASNRQSEQDKCGHEHSPKFLNGSNVDIDGYLY